MVVVTNKRPGTPHCQSLAQHGTTLARNPTISTHHPQHLLSSLLHHQHLHRQHLHCLQRHWSRGHIFQLPALFLQLPPLIQNKPEKPQHNLPQWQKWSARLSPLRESSNQIEIQNTNICIQNTDRQTYVYKNANTT